MLLFLAVKVSFRVAREEITKKKEVWFFIFTLLGVKFKISDEHPRPFYVGVPPPRKEIACKFTPTLVCPFRKHWGRENYNSAWQKLFEAENIYYSGYL